MTCTFSDRLSSLKSFFKGYMTNSGNFSSYDFPEGFYVSAITSGGSADQSDLEIVITLQ